MLVHEVRFIIYDSFHYYCRDICLHTRSALNTLKAFLKTEEPISVALSVLFPLSSNDITTFMLEDWMISKVTLFLALFWTVWFSFCFLNSMVIGGSLGMEPHNISSDYK